MAAWFWVGGLIFALNPCLRATNLNETFGLSIWQDSLLWDDAAAGLAHRLRLEGMQHEGTEYYRASFQGNIQALGEPLYSTDLHCMAGKPQRLVLGFINQADLKELGKALPEREYEKNRDAACERIGARLTTRLGPPSGEGPWHWSWMGHQIQLRTTSTALVLSIEKGEYVANQNPTTALVEKDHRPFLPAERVRRYRNGDVVITGIPPISQGARGFCVPVAWEKVLRYYGVALDVYALAESGGTTLSGSPYRSFASRIATELSPLSFQLDYLREGAEDLTALQKHIDQGRPLVWGIDAQLLDAWLEQTRRRRGALSESDRIARPLSAKPAYHALLIIGYNLGQGEIALSDSTELGQKTPEIWITREDARRVSLPSAPLIAVIPPNSLVAPTRPFSKTRWY